MDTLRTKHFRAESICLVFQNIQHRTEYSHLCLPPGLQSLDSAQMSAIEITCPVVCVWCFSDEG